MGCCFYMCDSMSQRVSRPAAKGDATSSLWRQRGTNGCVKLQIRVIVPGKLCDWCAARG